MRVLLVSAFVEPHVGGVEQFVTWLRGRLRTSGHDVRLLAVDHPGGADADVLVPSRFVGEEMPLTLPAPTVLRALRREVRRSDAVLVQQLGHTLGLWAAAVARSERRPVRTIFHAAGAPVHVTRLRGLLTDLYDLTGARLQSRLAAPLVPSAAAAAWARRRYGVAADLFPYPVRPLPVRRPSTREPHAPLRVVAASRLVGEKAPLDTLAACADVTAGSLTLDIYGDGPLGPAVRAEADDRPWVTVHGAVGWSDVVRAQREADMFLSTSVEDNVQVALLEALAMGVPSVATAVGEAPRYFPGDLARFCVAAHAPRAAAMAIAELRAGYADWQPVFIRNAERLRAEHSEDAAEARILATLVGSRRGRP